MHHYPLSDFPGYWLRRASNGSMGALLAKLDAHGFGLAEASLLVVVQSNPGITASEAGRLLSIARSNITPLNNKLTTRELVVRIPVNGKSNGLYLSPEGEKYGKIIMSIMEVHEEMIMSKIPKKFHANFVDCLRLLSAQDD